MSACVATHGCITCGDEAVPMRVLRVDEERGLALCADAQDAHASVEIALVAPVAPGEALLVHAGTALGRALEGPIAFGETPQALGACSRGPAMQGQEAPA